MRSFATIFFSVTALAGFAQDIGARTSNFTVDFATEVNADMPIIKWITPQRELTYITDSTYNVKFDIGGASPIKILQISLKDDIKSKSRISQKIQLELAKNASSIVEFEVDLKRGPNVIEIIAENADGAIATSYKTIQVGQPTSLRNPQRVDYALIFATDKYDNWPDLLNPVFDAHAIGEELENTYGFKVEVVENPTQNDVLKKIREYIAKQYTPFDQLFIFFAGHGTFDQVFDEGYLVPREALIADEGRTTYLSYNRLRRLINVVPCEHIFLTIDVCFGGTFDESIPVDTTSAGPLTERLMNRTRKFITSGERQYVSDGAPGRHSPFTRELLEAFRSSGGDDGVLTFEEITTYVSKLKIKPRVGEFGDNVQGSEFIFVTK